MGGAPHRPLGAQASGLRIITHNVKGLMARDGKKVAALVRQWACELNAHVVCIQETHMAKSEQATAQLLLDQAAAYYNKPRYVAHWAPKPAGATDSFAGVAILVRADRLPKEGKEPSGDEAAITGGARPRVRASADGRTLQLQLRWCGHTLNLVNTYVPAGAAKDQRDFITDTLGPIIRDAPLRAQLVVCGDFNFTEQPRIDRRPRRDDHETRERGATQAWQAAAAPRDLVDVFRVRHPHRAEFSYFQKGGPARSRIDRFYVDEQLMGYVEQCRPVGYHAPSDHRPVLLHLRPAAPRTTGKGLPKLRLTALNSTEGKTALSRAVSELVENRGLLTMDHERLIQYWPTFKAALTNTARALAKEFAQRRAAPSAARLAAEAERDAAEAALSQAPPGHPDAEPALQRMVAADTALTRAILEEARPADLHSRYQWLREGEHPSPLLSKLMSPPTKSGHIPCLKDPQGGLITGGRQLAEHAVQHYSAVSAKQPTIPESQAIVLSTITAPQVQPISAAAAADAGSLVVTEEEVLKAMKSTKANTSPGPDGIPAALWRWCKDPLAKVLARLYTAIGHTGTTPPGFPKGAVVALYKGKGDAAMLVNYRPITLLNTDYRLLAKVLATRWGLVLGGSISREQTAFLPGRLIGENIMLLQLLPAALRAQATSTARNQGAAVFLDFQKAYDTVDRGFLLAVMERMGAGAVGAAGAQQATGMTRWAQILLADTQAVAVINGHVSSARAWDAGVRQGCPLAPAMYLFVACALSCWLKAQPPEYIGISLGGERVTCPQHADDSLPLLPVLNRDTVLWLKECMAVFDEASRQQLNLPKCHILPFCWPEGTPMPDEILGFKVVRAAKTLGIIFTDGSHGRELEELAEWQELLKKVTASYDKLARLPLSAFGRAAAAAGYGVSTILYKAELSDVPLHIVDQLRAMTTKLVDKGLAPSASHMRPGYRLPGIRSDLLPGHPSLGGIGVLPWAEHTTARHAMWGKRLLEQLPAVPIQAPRPAQPMQQQHANPQAGGNTETAPWVLAAAVILRSRAPNSHPALTFLASCTTARAADLPSPALRRIARGLAALGPPSQDGWSFLPVDQWVRGMPLWNNPLLKLHCALDERPQDYRDSASKGRWADGAIARQPRLDMRNDLRNGIAHGNDNGFWQLASNPRTATVQQLVEFADEMAAAGPGADYFWADKAYVPALVAMLPPIWVCRARQGGALAAGELERLSTTAVTYVLRSIGWPAATVAAMPNPLKTAEGRRQVAAAGIRDATQWVPPKFRTSPYVQLFGGPLPLTVRLGTRMQQASWRAAVAEEHRRCIRAALQLGGEMATNEQVESERAHVATRLRAAWAIKWDNRPKETWWRLLLDGVKGAGGHGIALNGPCPCGWSAPAPLSQPQRAAAQKAHVFWDCPPAVAVRDALTHNLPPDVLLRPKHVWLLQPPCEQIRSEVWAVVGMVALAALESARKCMWALHKGSNQQGGQNGPARGLGAVGASSDEASDDDTEAARRQHRARRAHGAQAAARRTQRQQRRQDQAPATTPAQYATRRAVAQLVSGVKRFVDLGLVPAGWVGKVSQGHCFVGVRSRADPANENGFVHELISNMRILEGDVVR